MTEEQDAAEATYDSETQGRYFIDLDWYREQERSFITLAASRLCPSSHSRDTLRSETALLNTVKQCCSKREGFLTPNMPILEMIFRTFLANGNEPLDLEQLQANLQQYLAEASSPRDLSVRKLKRIIENDCYYGFGLASQSDEE